MKKNQDAGECCVADLGYNHDTCLAPDTMYSSVGSELHRKIKSRNQTVNKRVKFFQVLKQCFRHKISKHGRCFHADADITQLLMIYNALFDIVRESNRTKFTN